MGRIGKYVQTSDERKRYSIDYSEWLDSGETVSTAVFDILPVTVPALVVDAIGVFPDGLSIQYYVSGGLTGITYDAFVKITTNMSQIKEDGIVVSIREP
jgi:hypothetical protein